MSSRDPLDDLLDRWQHSSPPPDLRSEIRREITRAQHQAEATSWFARLELAFSRPSFAATFVAACVLFGLFVAEVRVARQHALYGAQIARSYVQLIDPLLAEQTQANVKEAK
jgi:hypothetical protein